MPKVELVSGSCFLFDAGCKGSLIYFLVNALPLVVAAGAALPFRSGTSHRLATVTGQPVLGRRGEPAPAWPTGGQSTALPGGKAVGLYNLFTNSYSLIRLICKLKISVEYNYLAYLMLPAVLLSCPPFPFL